MSMYRDDLEAALARNGDLERRVVELEHALRAERAPAAPRPAPAATRRKREVAPEPRRIGSIAYVRPATYWPAVRLFTAYVRQRARKVFRLPTVVRPELESDILVLDLLGRLTTLAWMPLAFAVGWLARVLHALFFGLVVVLVGLFTLPITVLGAPLVAALSFRRATSARPRGLQWGRAPSPDSTETYALVSASVAPLVLIVVLAQLLW